MVGLDVWEANHLFVAPSGILYSSHKSFSFSPLTNNGPNHFFDSELTESDLWLKAFIIIFPNQLLNKHIIIY